MNENEEYEDEWYEEEPEEDSEETTESTEADTGIDIYDYCIVGVPSIILILITIKFCFRKFHLKLSKSGLEMNTENGEEKCRK